MAGASLLALLDDIASVLDDVAVMTKVAAKKTAGVLGDDLALNAQQVAGLRADRELPVVWSVTKGSFRNKLILVPAALAISAYAPWGVTPLLMLGGAFLCYEGFEKLAHRMLHTKNEDDAHRAGLAAALADSAVDIVAFEREKIKGAIRTDFILSAEIIAITLGTVAAAPFWSQVAVLTGIAIIMTVGVYGLVAGIVKLDDAGLYLSARSGGDALRGVQRAIGRAILAAAPYLMKSLSGLGTAAMFMVGGGILVHGIPGLEALIDEVAHGATAALAMGGFLEALATIVLAALVGIVAGAAVMAGVALVRRMLRAVKREPERTKSELP